MSRRRCGALEGVGVHQAGGGKLLDVAVAVDAAGQHQLAARVDFLLSLVEPFADRRDLLAADADIGLEAVGRGRHRAAADHEIERIHARLSVTVTTVMPGHSTSRQAQTPFRPGIHGLTVLSTMKDAGWDRKPHTASKGDLADGPSTHPRRQSEFQ